METLETLQFEIFKLNRLAMEKLHDARMLLIEGGGNIKLLPIQRNIIKSDIETLTRVRHELRNLGIIELWNNQNSIQEKKE